MAPASPAASGRAATALAGGVAVRGIVCVSLLSVACNVGALSATLFNMQVFNRVLPTRDTTTLVTLLIGVAVCLVAYSVLDLLRGLALEALAGQLTRRLSLPLLKAVAAEGRGAGGTSAALADLETLRGFVSSPSCTAPFDMACAPLLLLALGVQHWGFALLGLLSCSILIALNMFGDRVTRREMLAANEASVAAVRRAADAVGAAEAVLALGMLPNITRRWEAGRRRSAGLVHRATLRARAVAAATTTLRMAMTGAMVALGLILAMTGLASSGSMVAANMILARLLLPFQQVASTRRRWVDATAAWRRICAALDDPAPPRYDHAMPTPARRLEVERLVFLPRGGDRALLRGVSFTAEPGESVGIIGASSAGKTTLVRLIMGMLPPTAGGVYLDGTSTYLWEREDFSRHVGYVPQGLSLLDETVAENIASLRTPDMAAVLAAARLAGVHRTIAALPRGYATRLAPGILSTGQRQRVALARALYRRPGLLVLDEPSAFLDAGAETELTALLGRLRNMGTTVLLVTHRPALVATMDKLVVLQDGLVSRAGTRTEVLEAMAKPAIRMLRASPGKQAVS